MRKERDGTVVRFSESASVTNNRSGSVRWPASRAEIVTVTGEDSIMEETKK